MEELKKYQEQKRELGSNYIIEYYIKKYENIVAKYEANPEFQYNREEHKKYKEKTLSSKKKSLKRKIRKGKASSMDRMMLDILRGR